MSSVIDLIEVLMSALASLNKCSVSCSCFVTCRGQQSSLCWAIAQGMLWTSEVLLRNFGGIFGSRFFFWFNIFGSHCENLSFFFEHLSMSIYELKFIHCPFHYYSCIAVEFCSAALKWWFMTCLCDLKIADKLFDNKLFLYLDFKFWCWSCIYRFF